MLSFQILKFININGFEFIVDLDDHNAHDQNRRDHIDENPDIYDKRHSVGRKNGCNKDTVLDDEVANDLANGFFPADHEEKSD